MYMFYFIRMLSFRCTGPYSSCRLISRQGYTIVDETYRPQFTDEPWPWVTTANVSKPTEQMCDIDPERVSMYVRNRPKAHRLESTIWLVQPPA